MGICTASTKTCSMYEPPACKATIALTGMDTWCKCGDKYCSRDYTACDPTKESKSPFPGEGIKGVCSIPTCPSSGTVTQRCTCVNKVCNEGEMCTDGTCTTPVCKVGEKWTGDSNTICKCGANATKNRASCRKGQMCTFQDDRFEC